MKRKIVIPYKMLNGISWKDSRIAGGMEKFGKSLIETVPHHMIPVEFTEEDQRKRTVVNKILAAVDHHKADMVLNNYDGIPYLTGLQLKLNVPIAWICHNLATAVWKLPIAECAPKFKEGGGSIFMVSKFQEKTWHRMMTRVNGSITEIDGFVNPDFAKSTGYISTDKIYDVCAVARCDSSKDPFSIFPKLVGSNKKGVVVTSKYKMEKNSDYYQTNLTKWNTHLNLKTFWNLNHSDVLDTIRKSKVFVSTLAMESWGITTFEALSNGVPVILFTQGESHASEEIAANPDHIIKLKKGCKPEVFLDAVTKLSSISDADRKQMSLETQEKHSKTNWIKSIENLVQKTITNYQSNRAASNTITLW